MRILHVLGALRLPRAPDVDGCSGVARATLELAREQAAQGHDVWIASVGEEAWRERWCGVQLVQLAHRPWARARSYGRTFDFRVHLPYIAFTRRERFDVVHGQMYPYLRFLRARARVAHFHHNPDTMSWSDLRRSVLCSHAQVGVSTFVTDQLRRRMPAARSVHTVHNGVDLAHFDGMRWQDERRRLRAGWGMGEGEVAFLFAGAIVPEKGVLTLGRAFARLSVTDPGVHLVLAGDVGLWDLTTRRHEGAHEYHAQVVDALEQVREPDHVHALGRVSGPDIAAVYAACDVLVVPSRMTPTFAEACPLVALEGMASGRPVIGSATGGLPEVIGLGAGTLFPADDEQALEAAMRELARDPEKRRALGVRARENLSHLTWNATVRRLEGIYRQHLGG